MRMTQEINIEEIKNKLVEKLKPSGWATKLRGFIQSSDFDKIIQKLWDKRTIKKRFTPPLKLVFRAFEECPIDKLKVVIIGQDPYPYFNVADGLAFSCSITGRPQASLKHIFQQIDQTVYPEELPDHDPDLTRWAEQGILLLNKALTTEMDKIGTDYDIWEDFIAFVVDTLNLTSSGLIFVLLGSKAQELEALIGDNHYILKAAHPASAAHNNGVWDCKDIFNTINNILERNNGKDYTITW